ncbi:MAG TPA: low molecular weight protein-tyrosine-phosphatase [Burkholderiales bacterium]|nr:low molecular weight protein-tyrosine-phosphatase [Burkholderiales bacterium]
MTQPVKVLFVCTGNICRSPIAEGVFTRLVREAGLAGRVVADSAGTHGYHLGEPPDPRARDAAAHRGYDLGAHRARQVSRRDFSEFDYVLAMDSMNLRALARLCPPEHARKVRLFMEFADGAREREVPDPYYGGREEFERVLDLAEEAARGLLDHLRRRLLGE